MKMVPLWLMFGKRSYFTHNRKQTSNWHVRLLFSTTAGKEERIWREDLFRSMFRSHKSSPELWILSTSAGVIPIPHLSVEKPMAKTLPTPTGWHHVVVTELALHLISFPFLFPQSLGDNDWAQIRRPIRWKSRHPMTLHIWIHSPNPCCPELPPTRGSGYAGPYKYRIPGTPRGNHCLSTRQSGVTKISSGKQKSTLALPAMHHIPDTIASWWMLQTQLYMSATAPVTFWIPELKGLLFIFMYLFLWQVCMRKPKTLWWSK